MKLYIKYLDRSQSLLCARNKQCIQQRIWKGECYCQCYVDNTFWSRFCTIKSKKIFTNGKGKKFFG